MGPITCSKSRSVSVIVVIVPKPHPDAPLCSAPLLVAETTHYLLRLDTVCRLVLAKRTAAPFERITDIGECFREMESAIAAVRRPKYKLLTDVRLGPARNDPDFEAAFAQHRTKLVSGFAKYAEDPIAREVSKN